MIGVLGSGDLIQLGSLIALERAPYLLVPTENGFLP